MGTKRSAVSSASSAGYPITVIQSSVLLTEICSQERYRSSVTTSAGGRGGREIYQFL